MNSSYKSLRQSQLKANIVHYSFSTLRNINLFLLSSLSNSHWYLPLPSTIAMKFSALAASLCSLTAFASANLDEKRAFNVALTFYGVDGSSYGETFPADTTSVRIG